MAHNIHGDRFVGFKSPAWHGIGTVLDEPTPATAAYEIMGGYDVTKMPAFAGTDGEMIREGNFFVVRLPTQDDAAHRVFGNTTVGKNWVNVTPRETVEIAEGSIRDEHGKTVGVETIASLGFGEKMFITYRLAPMGVATEDVDRFLIYLPAFQPGQSHKVITSAVRVVCQNTMMMAIQGAADVRNFAHVDGVQGRIADWLANAYEHSMNITRQAQDEFGKMAATPLTAVQVKMIVGTLYPDPKPPKVESSLATRSIADRESVYEANLRTAQIRREHVATLFDGEGIGMDAPALKGTAYGLYQAVCEYETYRPGKAASVPIKLIEGDRGAAILKAYTACLKVTT